MKDLIPAIDLPIDDFYERLKKQRFVSRSSKPEALIVAVEIPCTEVNMAYKINKDKALDEVKTDGKSTWYMIVYSLCPKTKVLVYFDH